MIEIQRVEKKDGGYSVFVEVDGLVLAGFKDAEDWDRIEAAVQGRNVGDLVQRTYNTLEDYLKRSIL